MITIPGYKIISELYESAGSLVYRARREGDEKPVILKALKAEYPAPAAIARYKLEYEITRNLNQEGTVRAYSLEKYKNSPVMVLEDFGGESLKIGMKSWCFARAAFLRLALAVAEILGAIHAGNIIHKDINPSNIVYNPATGQVKIIDFGISTVLSRENPTLSNPNVLEGTLAYMSPEQTGRMNRAIDYRSDFYSLGATFYELLTGRLPFDTGDAMELVHCHMAKVPVPPHKVNPQIPKAISDIVMKLLAKTAEERYQSAWGIKADLEQCLTQLETTGIITEFTLGCQDVSDKFQISQKLYGREAEVATLLAAFARVAPAPASESEPHTRALPGSATEREENAQSKIQNPKSKIELMLVAGYSGIGKSALVQEIYKPITQQRGYFISGKFDQLQRNIPYASLIQAFSSLVRQLLTESEAQIAGWREKLQAALGVNGQVIVDVIPEVELILGKQPAVPELGPVESQNRFNFVFQNFLKVFAQPEHPLVIFLDDLQWADGASLKLIQQLMTALDSQSLLLIGAYRDSEVNAAHPLMLAVGEIEKAGAAVSRISLAPLELATVSQLIADTLNCSAERVKPLAELVFQKTGGNPFFMNEFLKSLYAEGLLNFDFNRGGWQWELEQIKAAPIAGNVVDLMAGKIQKLSESTQHVLQLAACIGNQFDLKTLSVVRETSHVGTAAELWEAVEAGLIVPVGSDYKFLQVSETGFLEKTGFLPQYKFVHDRVQQAAYSLIPTERKREVHRQIGQLLLENTPGEAGEEKIFDIVNQLNLGAELIASQPEKDELAQLNLAAGKKAKASAAYEPAFKYLQAGIALLAPDSWQTQYPLTLALYEQTAEVAYVSADFAHMEQCVEAVLSYAKTVVDKVKVCEVKIQAYSARGKFTEAISLGLEMLKLLGVALPKKPSKLDVLLGLMRTKLAIGRRPIANLADLPLMTAPYPKAAMRILVAISSSAYSSSSMLAPLIVFKQVSLSLKWGNTLESTYAYSNYGLILCSLGGDISGGEEWGKLALNLLVKLNASEFKAKIKFMVNYYILSWVVHLNKTLFSLQEGYRDGLETGDLEYGLYSLFSYCDNAFLSGSELFLLESEMALCSKVIRERDRENILAIHQLYHQTVLNLIGRAENPCCLMGEACDESVMLPKLKSQNYWPAIFGLYFRKLMLCCIFGESLQAVSNAEFAEFYLKKGLINFAEVYNFYFYDSLARLAVATPPTPPLTGGRAKVQKRLLRKVRANQKKMQKWAHHAPANNLHKFYLVEAERYRVLGKDVLAMEMYDRAIATAKENEYIHEEALAHELAAKFYLAKGKAKIASVYMHDARYCYQLWGAAAKVKDLDRRYPQLLSQNSSVTRTGATGITSTSLSTSDSGRSSELDLATVMKASQAIAGEIVLDKLLEKLMEILIENAGAQKGYLILESKGNLLIEAEGAVDTGSVTVLQSIPIEGVLPAAIINYVARTQESVVLDDAAGELQNPKSQLQNLNDSYILENKPKSVLCAPLLNKGQLTGILYLENNLTAKAFTPDRLEVLKLLSGQAAISIENALLYSELRESESRLAQFLEAVPVGVFVVDATGKSLYTNRLGQELVGRKVPDDPRLDQFAEVAQSYIAGTSELYPVEKMPVVRALSGESSRIDDMEIHQPDKIVPLEVWGTPIYDAQGNLAYGIAAFQDITERKRAEAERERFTSELFQLNLAYERFVPREFLEFLQKKSIVDVKLGDQVQQEMAVLFSDIRDFTALSESMTPADNFKFINSYLSRMEPVINANRGFIDKYIGDAIMALFSGGADDAVKAGIAMLHRLVEYNRHRQSNGYVPIQIGIGINTGSLMLGTVGGHNRMDGTVISDAVNLASRVEGLTKNYGVSLLITHETFVRLTNPGDYAFRIIGRARVKGKSEMVSVFEVFDADPPALRAGKLATKTAFEQALLLYYMENFPEAAQLFQDCLRLNPQDKPAHIYLERCRQQ